MSEDKIYSDSKLYLKSVKECDEVKYYDFIWILSNYQNLDFNVKYVCHCICIGKKIFYLKIRRSRSVNSKASDVNNRCRVDLDFEISPYLGGVDFLVRHYSDSCRRIEEKPFTTPNGQLEVICKITLSRKCGMFPQLSLPLLETEQSFKVFKHMDEMFDAGLFPDLSISVGEKIFNVHKGVLANRSKVFATMLEANMKEKAENRIVIEDCESEIYGEFLRYIYSNKLNLSNVKAALEFYQLSEKYDFPELKQDSSIFLARNLSADNVIQMQKFADLHQDSKLKEATMDYMFRNLLEVMKSPDWSSFTTSTNDVNNLFLILGKFVSEDKVYKDFRPLFEK